MSSLFVIFPSERENETKEEEYSKGEDPLMTKLREFGEKKLEEPLHRTKALRAWPTEKDREEIYQEMVSQLSGTLPSKEAIEAWKSQLGKNLWEIFTTTMEESEKERVLKENAIQYIAKIVANTIHMEHLYRQLKSIGEQQWEVSSKGLKTLVEEDSLLSITERPELFELGNRRGKIEDWVKGTIIYFALQRSMQGNFLLKKTVSVTPDINALKEAALWCLSPHFKVQEEEKTLEETREIFEHWKKKREKIDLKIVPLKIQEIPEEIPVPDPTDKNGLRLPWNLTWRIIPILEKEIRELGEEILKKESFMKSLSDIYKKKLFDRWTTNFIRRSYIRLQQLREKTSERWRVKTLILSPTDVYVNERIAGETLIKLTAKTEAVWYNLTEELPEPNIK